MLKTGLVSITFRKLNPVEIVTLVSKAGLEGVEWGGDIHVPHGDFPKAKDVRKITEDAGLDLPSYGSYYRLVQSEEEGLEFGKVLDTACELGTPVIRVWAGGKGSDAADNDYRKKVIDESRRIADLADARSVTIAYEYHGNTLTDTNESAKALLKEVDHPNVKTYWQPPVGMEKENCLEGINNVLEKLVHLHVFHWHVEPRDRRPLKEGVDVWREYFTAAEKAEGEHYALLEFVRDDDPEMFLKDAETLKKLVMETSVG